MCRTIRTFDDNPEAFVLEAPISAQGNEDRMCTAGDIKPHGQVSTTSQRQFWAVVDDEDVRRTAGLPFQHGVCGNANQKALVAVRHEAANAFGVGRVASWVEWARNERAPMRYTLWRRTDICYFASYTT